MAAADEVTLRVVPNLVFERLRMHSSVEIIAA